MSLINTDKTKARVENAKFKFESLPANHPGKTEASQIWVNMDARFKSENSYNRYYTIGYRVMYWSAIFLSICIALSLFANKWKADWSTFLFIVFFIATLLIFIPWRKQQEKLKLKIETTWPYSPEG